MSPLFDYLWPSIAIGIVAGASAGTIAWRRQLEGLRKKLWLVGAALAAIGGSLLWSGPLGAADQFIAAVEAPIRQLLADYEMTQVTGTLERGPLSAQVFLRGPADDLQRSELVRMIEELPGVAEARWNHRGHPVPLILEGAGAALAGLFLGLFLAYLNELRRRNNAEWSW